MSFPPGASVLVDGRTAAVVDQHYPDGSSSYGFPHYAVRVGGDARERRWRHGDVARDRGERTVVAEARVGVVRRP